MFTEFEESHLSAIKEFARNAANRRWENLRCLDAAGTRMHDMSCGLGGVVITDTMKSVMRAGEGARFWHNHPSQDSLSHHDWICAGSCPDVEILATNERGSIFVGRIPAWDDRLRHVLKEFPRLSGDLALHLDTLAKEAGLDFDNIYALGSFTGHVQNLALAECLAPSDVLAYGYCLVQQDQAVVDACSRLGIIASGIGYARSAIQGLLAGAPAPTASNPRLVGVNHVALEVGDIEAALHFYGAVFSFELRGRHAGDAEQPPMAFLDMGDQFIALIAGREPPEDVNRHFGLVVDDRSQVMALAEAAGAKILDRPFNFVDPWGNLVEVVAYRDVQFSKTAEVLRGMGLDLDKSDEARDELRRKLARGGS
ncbi:VOC family protein [Methylobacterium sp. E-046]|uniref:VOC family protein n=1 Tax=Methylobacterium sp. E-046 TaxID=2836576 RepID=UPI001FBA7B36|nr:VOC family protein [Methylobacterium sp. E-046]MCJ2099035.1 VOC family protein [Methylobacterium sp. E-046]